MTQYNLHDIHLSLTKGFSASDKQQTITSYNFLLDKGRVAELFCLIKAAWPKFCNIVFLLFYYIFNILLDIGRVAENLQKKECFVILLYLLTFYLIKAAWSKICKKRVFVILLYLLNFLLDKGRVAENLQKECFCYFIIIFYFPMEEPFQP